MTIDPETSVRAVLTRPVRAPKAGLRAAIVLAHGAGGTMDQPLLVAFGDALAARGASVLRFNFAYTDRGRKAPDRPPLLLAALRAAAAVLARRPESRGVPLVLGGKSMGGRVASHAVALGDRADGLVFLGYPLHPAGQPEKLRDAHLGDVRAPMLFLEGTRDPLCDLALLRPVLRRIRARATLHVVEGGDHSFAVPKSLGRSPDDVLAELVDATAAWIGALPTSSSPGAAARPRQSRAASSASRRAGTTGPKGRRAPRM